MRPKATAVKPLKGYKLLVTFDNGEVKVYDADPLIKGDWFGQLRDIKMFDTVHIAGLSVEWAGGQDVCPDDLYYSSETYVPADQEHSVKKIKIKCVSYR